MPPTALAGIRVLDLTDLSAAYAGKLLADMGAEVVRVERTGAPRDLTFQHYNGGKQIVEMDLDDPSLQTLAAAADVLLETLPPGAIEKMDVLRDDLVHVSIAPFGRSGPYRDWRACDLVAQSMGGMVFVNGHAHEAPLAGFGLQAYHSASAYAAIAALLGLFERRRGGRGGHADVSLQACVAATVEHVSGFFQQTSQVEERRGSLHWSRYFRVGRCRDGHVMHCTLGDWTSLVEWVKSDGQAQDLDRPQWDDFAYRKANCEHVFDVLDTWAAGYDVAALVEGAQLRRVPYAPVMPLASLRHDPQLSERGFFVEVDGVRHAGAPYRFSATPWRRAAGSAPSGLERRGFGEDPGRCPGLPDARQQSSPEGAEPAPKPLAGIRIVDFTWVVAGPVATRILADHGAEVIKIERRDSLDFGSRRGGLTGNLNRGKESLVLDMARPEGIAIARDLLARADVVVDNFSARVMPNWGLDYESLRALNPGIIAVGMSGFGRTGPYRDYVSYGPTLQALTGFTAHMRHEDGEPAGWGFSYSDMAGGYSAALAVLVALWHRQQTGEGQFIDLAQYEALAALIGVPLLETLNGGTPRLASANRSFEGDAAPHGVYRCRSDRWCAIAVFGEDDWQRFAAALGSPAWAREARFATLAARMQHLRALDAHVSEWTRTRVAEDVMQALQAAGIAAGVVADAEDLCRRDPQLRHRGYWVELPTPEGESVTLDGVPFLWNGKPCRPAGPGPLLGEHTDTVLRRVLGMSAERIAELRNAGVVA